MAHRLHGPGAMVARRLPIGTEVVTAEDGAHIRVWAPLHDKVAVVLEGRSAASAASAANAPNAPGARAGITAGSKTVIAAPGQPREVVLGREADGYHSGLVAGLTAGTRYRFRLGNDPALIPDPASRFQPEGPMGPSEVVDPSQFAWTDAGWKGIAPDRHVLYELHVGTFTPEGTWRAAAEWLGYLADVGITTLEIMPIAEFAGRHNWGYDGVNLFAPSSRYGTPDDLRRFVDRAHAAGLAVILDVVYNHFGPSGNTLCTWSPYYQSADVNEWGNTLNFDGEHAGPVRDLVIANAGYWIDEFHLDGLRLDATQAIRDRSPEHIIGQLTRRARAAGRGRQIFVVGENEPQDAGQLREPIALDAMWNDDFHHSARINITGVIEGYLHDYRGTAQELVSAIKHGFLYQGQMYAWQRNPRGGPSRGLARHRFVHFLENHDQVANVGFGERLSGLCDGGTLRALTAALLLGPALPMLFQGQECGAREPWHFFVDHEPGLRDPVRNGRAAFMAQFARLATPEAQAELHRIADPCAEATFRRCVLDPRDRRLDHPCVMLHRDLLRLRRVDPAFTDPRPEALDGAVLSDSAFVIRYFQPDPAGDRLLVVNLGSTLIRTAVPEPLIAPPDGMIWRVLWSSEDPRYGGHGTPPPVTRARTALPGRAALVLAPEPGSLRVELTPEDQAAPVEP